MTTLPRAILFDMDDTLLSSGPPEAAWLAVADEFADRLAPLSPVELADAISAYARVFWSDAARHKAWRFDIQESRRRIVADVLADLAAQGRPVPDAALGRALADRFTAERDTRLDILPNARDVIVAFRERGVRLALVTNGESTSQRAKIVRFDLAPHFDHIQIEGEHGFGKPEEQAYLHAMQALGVEAAETWMVGDHLEWEVAAPQRLGIFAIWHDVFGQGLPPGSPIRPDRIIRSLAELLPVD
ncbi:HAD family hydrolase [Zavarzinia sp. CC-PAN008]|uniref:HAD family hydrolase n=1 Tax=Zavarzinia sp. CC-PAN008 TaxID=3243332 RepID=UPI003F74AB30